MATPAERADSLDVDITQIEESIRKQDSSRQYMHDNIMAMKDIIVSLSDAWEGEDKDVLDVTLTEKLNAFYHEKMRLNQMAYEMKRYVERLREEESQIRAQIENAA